MLMAEYDYATDVAVQREESYEEGYKAGLAAASFEIIAEIIKKMHEYGVGIDMIAKVAAMDEDKIRNILQL